MMWENIKKGLSLLVIAAFIISSSFAIAITQSTLYLLIETSFYSHVSEVSEGLAGPVNSVSPVATAMPSQISEIPEFITERMFSDKGEIPLWGMYSTRRVVTRIFMETSEWVIQYQSEASEKFENLLQYWQ